MTRVVFLGVIPLVAAALVGLTLIVSRDRPARSLVVYGPKVWPAGAVVPLRVAVLSGDGEVEPPHRVLVRADGKAVRVGLGASGCDARELRLVAPRAIGRLTVEVHVTTSGGEARARFVVDVAPRAAREVETVVDTPRQAVSGDVLVTAAPAGGAVAPSRALPIYLRFQRANGTPWSGRAALAIRTGSLQKRPPGAIDVAADGHAELRLVPLLSDVVVEVTADASPARLVLPVRAARPTVHVREPADMGPAEEIEVRSESGARCVYLDVFEAGVRRAQLSARLRGGRASFRMPVALHGVVALQAATHFSAEPEGSAMRHVEIGRLVVGDGSARRFELAREDGKRYRASLVADGGEVVARATASRRGRVRSRALVGIGLCAVAELSWLARTLSGARRRAREIASAAARETGAPTAARGDLWQLLALLAAALAGFALLAAVAGMVS